jgi:Subtilase family
MTSSGFRPYFHCTDPRGDRQRLADLRTVYKQVGRLNRRQNNLALRRDLTALLRGRRAKREDRPALPQFDVVPDPRGDEIPVVPQELLIRAEAADRRGGRNLIAAYGLKVSRRLGDRLVQVTAPDASPTRLADLAGALTAHGVAASMNYVVPTGAVWKGLGGPEPSAGPGPSRPAPSDGERIAVAVVDTGITAQQRTDDWLTDVVRDDNIDDLDVLPGPPDGLLDIAAGHGTFVTGVLQQVAPDADIRVYRALDTDGIGSEVDAAAAMVQAVQDGAQILNLSLGIETLDDEPPVALAVALEIIHDIEVATGRDVVIVAAAGNYGHDRPCWPAAFDAVTGVAALTQDLAPADWSTRGSWVDCSTIGEGVRSTYVEGTESPLIDPEPDAFGPDPWALSSGTSFAAPQIAAAIALIAREEGVNVGEARRRLLDGLPTTPGYGAPIEILPRI